MLLFALGTVGCSELPVPAEATPAPLVMATPKPDPAARTPVATITSQAAAPASSGAFAPPANPAQPASAFPASISAPASSSVAAPAASIPVAPPPAAPVQSAPAPAVAPPPPPVATPKPTQTPKPTATPIPAGHLVATGISARRVDQSFLIRVTIQNTSAAPVNAFTISVGWLDGGHSRGGEFGVDAPDGVILIDAGKTYVWTTNVYSTAITRPLSVLALQSTLMTGDRWHVPPGTAPLLVK